MDELSHCFKLGAGGGGIVSTAQVIPATQLVVTLIRKVALSSYKVPRTFEIVECWHKYGTNPYLLSTLCLFRSFNVGT